MVKVAVKGMQTIDLKFVQVRRISSNDESLGAWIYFKTNEPIGRSYAQRTELIRTNNL